MRGSGGALAAGGGLGGVVVLVVVLLLGGSPQDAATLTGLLDGTTVGNQEPNDLTQECQTDVDANAREDCRILGYVNSIQAYWETARRPATPTQPPTPPSSRAGVNTGCGQASSAVGPFYCPPDQLIYIDLGFFDDLRSPLRRPGRSVRPGLRHRPRVRPPRPGPARDARSRRGRHRSREPGGPDRAPGRLLRGRVGEPRRRRPATSSR